jgi:signal transduction histidine kinase/CheY-like chemotaxis protein
MYSKKSDYLNKLLDFSEEVEGVSMSFVDADIENFYVKENHKIDQGKSRSYSFLVISGYIVGITMSIVMNSKLTRNTYLLLTCVIVDIIMSIISRFMLERYLIVRMIKKVRFILLFLSHMLSLMFPINNERNNMIRHFYVFFAYTNVLFTYYVEFNYIMIILIPLLNSFLIVFVQYYQEFDKFYLLPEFLFNLFYYYAIFIIKKYEFLLNKKLFYEIYKNQQSINYIKQLIDVINTHVISINKEEVLFMNNIAINFFETNSSSDENNLLFTEKENTEVIINTQKQVFNDQVFSFFKQLKIKSSNSVIDVNKGESLLEILMNLFNENNYSQNFTRLGVITDEKSLFSFEIYTRNLNFKQSVIEILLYDISQIKQAEQTKVETKFKKKILAKIAHEFKTPLITIISLINRIVDYHQRKEIVDHEIANNLYYIENLSNYTLSLIGDITQYVSDKLDFKLFKKEIGIKETLDFSYNVLDTLIKCNENKVNRIQTKLLIKDSLESIRILTDENRLKQILLNFVSNAYKFTQKGFIKIKAKILSKDHMVEISVKDSGLGIRDDKQHLVFQEFTQFNLSNEYNSKGTGLGLSICKQISDSLKHKIGFVSKNGKGSKFYIRIEYKSAEEGLDVFNNTFSFMKKEHRNSLKRLEKRKSMISEKIDISKYSINGNSYNKRILFETDSVLTKSNRYQLFKQFELEKEIYEKKSDKEILNSRNSVLDIVETNSVETKYKLLVIDDQQLIRENTVRLIKNVLSSLNMSSDFDIIEGSDGIELLNLIRLDKDNLIKCVLIDENMEYLNGSETVSIIRKLEQYRKIKRYLIVSISGLDDPETKDRLLRSGLDLVITKPCQKNDITKILFKLN